MIVVAPIQALIFAPSAGIYFLFILAKIKGTDRKALVIFVNVQNGSAAQCALIVVDHFGTISIAKPLSRMSRQIGIAKIPDKEQNVICNTALFTKTAARITVMTSHEAIRSFESIFSAVKRKNSALI